MKEIKEKSLDDSKRLIAAVQRRLSRQHSLGLMGWFILAGLSLAFVPLAASKIRFCNSWVSTILPILTLSVSLIFGAVASWTSRPTLKVAAHRIDQFLATKELFVTALQSRHIDPTIPIHRLFCQTLKQACERGEVRRIAPSPMNQVTRFLAVILLVDAALFATPNMQGANHVELQRLQDHVTQWAAARDDLTQKEREAFESLSQARTQKALHATVKKLWLKMKKDEDTQARTLAQQLNALETAVAQQDIESAKRTLNSVRKALKELKGKENRDSVTKRLSRIASKTNDSSLAAELKGLGENGDGSTAGMGKATNGTKNTSSNSQSGARMKDLLVTVFGSLGEAPPEFTGPGADSRLPIQAQETPKQVQTSKQVSALGLGKTDEQQVLRYLELRRTRR